MLGSNSEIWGFIETLLEILSYLALLVNARGTVSLFCFISSRLPVMEANMPLKIQNLVLENVATLCLLGVRLNTIVKIMKIRLSIIV